MNTSIFLQMLPSRFVWFFVLNLATNTPYLQLVFHLIDRSETNLQVRNMLIIGYVGRLFT